MIGRVLVDVEYDSYNDSLSSKEYIPYIIGAIEDAGLKVNGYYYVEGYDSLRRPKSNKKRDVKDVVKKPINHRRCPMYEEIAHGPFTRSVYCHRHGRTTEDCEDFKYTMPLTRQKRK